MKCQCCGEEFTKKERDYSSTVTVYYDEVNNNKVEHTFTYVEYKPKEVNLCCKCADSYREYFLEKVYELARECRKMIREDSED